MDSFDEQTPSKIPLIRSILLIVSLIIVIIILIVLLSKHGKCQKTCESSEQCNNALISDVAFLNKCYSEYEASNQALNGCNSNLSSCESELNKSKNTILQK